MKAIESVSSAGNNRVSIKRHSRTSYRKVLDGRKQPIRGLWQRGDRFYARLNAEDVAGRAGIRWFPLFKDDAKEQPCATVAEAVAAFEDIKSAKRKGNLAKTGQTPMFSDYVDDYFKFHDEVRKAAREKAAKTKGQREQTTPKRESTTMRERGPLDLWKKHLAGLRLHNIRKHHIQSFIDKRQKEGMTGRTCNYDVIALRNVLKRALGADLIAELPMKNFKPIKHTPPTRELVTAAQIDQVCAKALEVSKNGQQFSDYVKLMAFCGSRRDETLRLKWSDVNWLQKQLVIGADGLAKNHQSRSVNFNADLEGHLKDMETRRAPETEWMFPSPQRGEKDIHAKSFRETLELARTAANLPTFGFHDCRHHFISFCVMSGVDYMTIAKWVGHVDGGVLIGKVYGHLNDTHKATMAARVSFQPVVLLEKTA